MALIPRGQRETDRMDAEQLTRLREQSERLTTSGERLASLTRSLSLGNDPHCWPDSDHHLVINRESKFLSNLQRNRKTVWDP